jgi:hypothetical protein
MGKTRKKVRPGQRAGIGVGNVDFDLRHDHEQHDRRQCQTRIGENVRKTDEVHLCWFAGLVDADLVLQCEKREKRATQELGATDYDPARSGHQQGGPPACPVVPLALRQETQKVHLFGNLGNQ